MANRLPPLRSIQTFTDGRGRPTIEFLRWLETSALGTDANGNSIEAVDSKADNAASSASDAAAAAEAAQDAADAAAALGVGSSVFYNFPSTTNVPANTWTTLDWTDQTNILLNKLADGSSYLTDTGRVRALDLEVFALRVDIQFSADDATASFLRFGLTDDAGGFGTFIKPLHPVLLGALVADEATYYFPTFTSFAINAAGWLPQVFSDGPVTITTTQAQFERVVL